MFKNRVCLKKIFLLYIPKLIIFIQIINFVDSINEFYLNSIFTHNPLKFD